LTAPISIGKITAGDWPSTVPESLVAEGRFGILPGERIQDARIQFEAAITAAADQDPWLCDHKPEVQWFEGQFEPGETPLDAPIVSALQQAHASILGSPAEIHGVPYGSDLRFFTNYAEMDAVLYGPGDAGLAHSLDEHVSIEEVLTATKVIALTLLQWNKQ
ncbi:MAG TPA: M20/M25/M40 family metallo-hydrolase, partial [Acidobacteriota bacterium]|nr:M20/M25/M40 family metallo-hydrolase [Acidobacteriota bacterium]